MKHKVILLFTLLLLIQLWLAAPNLYSPRFAFIPLNYFAFALICIGFLTTTTLVCYRLKYKWIGYPLSVVSAVMLLFISVPSLLAIAEGVRYWQDGVDHSFEKIAEVDTDAGYYRLYRTNCGAPCSYGLALRHEYDAPLGIKLVKSVWGMDRIYEAELVQTQEGIEVQRAGKLLTQLR